MIETLLINDYKFKKSIKINFSSDQLIYDYDYYDYI